MVWHKTIGNGPTKVIVIHGWFWDHRVFTPIFDCLDTASHTYAFVDIRGYGNSRNVSGEYTIGEVAADAIALADQLMSSAIPWEARPRRRWRWMPAHVSSRWWRSPRCRLVLCHSMMVYSDSLQRPANRTRRHWR